MSETDSASGLACFLDCTGVDLMSTRGRKPQRVRYRDSFTIAISPELREMGPAVGEWSPGVDSRALNLGFSNPNVDASHNAVSDARIFPGKNTRRKGPGALGPDMAMWIHSRHNHHCPACSAFTPTHNNRAM